MPTRHSPPPMFDLSTHNIVIVVRMDVPAVQQLAAADDEAGTGDLPANRIVSNEEFFAKVARLEALGVHSLGCVVFDHPISVVVIAAHDRADDAALIAGHLADDPTVEVLPGAQFFTACQVYAAAMNDLPVDPEVCGEIFEPGTIHRWTDLRRGCLYVDVDGGNGPENLRYAVCRLDGQTGWATTKEVGALARGDADVAPQRFKAFENGEAAASKNAVLIASGLGTDCCAWLSARARFEADECDGYTDEWMPTKAEISAVVRTSPAG